MFADWFFDWGMYASIGAVLGINILFMVVLCVKVLKGGNKYLNVSA